MPHCVSMSSGDRPDYFVLNKQGFTGLTRSPRFHRPRWPYCSKPWCPGNRVYDCDNMRYIRATSPLSYGCRVKMYGQSLLSRALSSFPELLATENIHGFVARYFPTRLSELLPRVLGLEEYKAHKRMAQEETLSIRSIDSRVVIVGGGYAGMVTALELSKYNIKSIIVDYSGTLGGFLRYVNQDMVDINNMIDKAQDVVPVVKGSYIGFYDEGHAILASDGVYITRGPIVYAGGGESPPPVTVNNDLPGIVSAYYGLEILEQTSFRPRRVAVIGYGYWAPYVADTIASKGIETYLISVGGTTEGGYRPEKAQLIESKSIKGFHGGEKIHGILLGDGDRLEVDMVLSALGEYPDAHPLYGVGYMPVYREKCWVFGVNPPTPGGDVGGNIVPAGSVLGYEDLRVVEASAKYAAALVAYMLGLASEQDLEHYYSELREAVKKAESSCLEASRPPVWLSESISGLQFIDLDEDILLQHVYSVWAKGYKRMEMLKRFTGLGTSAEQGRFSAVSASLILASLEGVDPSTIGLFRARPPYSNPEVSVLAQIRM